MNPEPKGVSTACIGMHVPHTAVDEDVVMEDASGCINEESSFYGYSSCCCCCGVVFVLKAYIFSVLGDDEQKQHLEDKVPKFDPSIWWENRLPNLRAISKVFDREVKEELYNPYQHIPTAWQVNYSSTFLCRSFPQGESFL